MKRVLIVTYYWPPSAGSGVQRWLKFAKYLPEFGWQPVVFTPENPDFGLRDESLLEGLPASVEVVKYPIWEPYQLLKVFSPGKKEKKLNTGVVSSKGRKSIKDRTLSWVRGNFLIPDPRVFWVRPSLKFLKAYLKEHPVDAVVTTGPPHSMHLIGKGLKEALDLPWVVDIRDPWSKLDFLDTFLVTPSNRKKYERMEVGVLNACDIVTATSFSMPELLQPFDRSKFHCITNGYDAEDFSLETPFPERFTVFHAGLLNELRNPSTLWKVLANISSEVEEFAQALCIRLAGVIDPAILEEIRSYPELSGALEASDYLSHEQVLQEYQEAYLLLLLINNTDNARVNIPGKLFEYLAARRPVLGLGDPDADAMKIIKDTGVGDSSPYEDYQRIKELLLKNWQVFLSGTGLEKEGSAIHSFSRKVLTRKMAELLNALH